jgi:N-acetyl-anhydromuramyl-L-alanine amidase AmpD
MQTLPMPVGAEARYGRNCQEGRQDLNIDWIVFHITYGSWQSLINCLTSSTPADYQRSAHIWAARDGGLYEMVKPEDTAWTCGLKYPRGDLLHPNQRSLNIEMICEANQIITDAQYDSVRWIMKEWALVHHIPIKFPSTGFEGYWGYKNGDSVYIRPDDTELSSFRGIMGHSAITRNRCGDPGKDHFSTEKLFGGELVNA